MVKTKLKSMEEYIKEYVGLFLEYNNIDSAVIDVWKGEDNQSNFNKMIKEYKKKQEKKDEKKKKHVDSPKKPCSAYICFSNNTRPQIKESSPEINNTEIMVKLGELWKTECYDESKMKHWKELAEKDKERYTKEMEVFYENHPEEKKNEVSKPKKPKTVYVIFCNTNRAHVVSSNPGMSPNNVMRKLATMWKEASKDKDSEEYLKYVKLAEQDKEMCKNNEVVISEPEIDKELETVIEYEVVTEPEPEVVAEPKKTKTKNKSKAAKNA